MGQDCYGFPLKAAFQPLVLDRQGKQPALASSVTETVLYTFPLAGRILQPPVRLRLLMDGIIANGDGAFGTTISLRLKLGATTLVTLVTAGGDGSHDFFSTASGYVLEALIEADGSLNAQLAKLAWRASPVPTSVTFDAPIVGCISQVLTGTGAEDAAAAKALVVTGQWSASNAADTLTQHHAALFLE